MSKIRDSQKAMEFSKWSFQKSSNSTEMQVLSPSWVLLNKKLWARQDLGCVETSLAQLSWKTSGLDLCFNMNRSFLRILSSPPPPQRI